MVTKEGKRRGKVDGRVTKDEVARLQSIFSERVIIYIAEIKEARD